MKHRKGILFSWLALGTVFALLMTACQALGGPTPEEELLQTSAAQTLGALQTQTAVAAIEQEGTQVAQTQTAQALPTNTALPTATPTLEPTSTPNSESDSDNTDSDCLQASFVEDVTIEDRSLVDQNESFTKIWRLENASNCVWDKDYMVVFSSGYQMGAPGAIDLPEDVTPGETVDIAIDMIAPDSPGVYTGYWMLMSAEGEVFGVGDDNDAPFWVRVRVTEEEEELIYNLAENVCEAGWESSVEEDIACPSEEDLEDGFVQPVEMPQLEDGKTYDEPTILTYPDSDRGGYMVGRYPGLTIEEGDHFRATIGCQSGAENCDVTFTLRAAITGEGFHNLGRWREVYDGRFYPIDVDLSEYAGMEIELVLSVIAADDSDENFALWLDPRVVHDESEPETTKPCHWASFVEDVTIEDRSILDPNETFTKIWRFENIGECTWTTQYQIVFHSGNQMDAPHTFDLPDEVEPGDTVDISLDMVAPDSPGIYTGYWMLMDEERNRFGIGEDADAPFWVRIRVTEEDEFIVYNLAENACEAGWESSVEEVLPCPGEVDVERGFVQFLKSPTLENGTTYDEPAILTYPDTGRGGYVVGRYPSLEIQDGDRFKASIACQEGAENCNVTYTLRVAITGEGFDKLGQWREVNEGLFYPVDVDLSEYAGQEVEITLSAIAYDDTGENFAIWLDPRLVRQAD